jgi:hypothetical protein
MNRGQVLAALEGYESELAGILSRFTKDRKGIYIQSNDDARFRAMVLQLRDLFSDEFVSSKNHIQPLLVFYNDSISNYFGSPSYRGVANVQGVVTAALTRVRRNPMCLKEDALAMQKVGAKDPDVLITLAERIHNVVCRLRGRRESRSTLDVQDEYDLQDLFHALLTIHFEDIRKEEWSPTHAGGASRMDFLLPEIETVVELKKSRSSMSAKELGEQLIIDIARYKKHPMCRTLFCVVYDPEGRIANPRGVESDLNSETGEVAVRVMIVPQ